MKISLKKIFMQIVIISAFLMMIIFIGSIANKAETEKVEELEHGVIENANTLEQYYGKWKVIQYIPLNRTKVEQIIWHKEHYLGRTVEIAENFYKKSIYYWPDEIGEYIVHYDSYEVIDMDRDDAWITRNAESLRWIEGDYFDDSLIRILVFYQNEKDYPKEYCAVAKDNEHLIVSWLSGEYLLERFSEQDSDVTLEDIYGEWEITRLDSYDNTYEGHIKDVEYIPEYRIEHLKFSEFYAPDWFFESVSVTDEELKIGVNIKGQITKIQSQVVDKELFEKEEGIHDGLSLNNGELLIYQIYYGEGDDVLTVVPVNKNKMIVHIEMGWFVLEK